MKGKCILYYCFTGLYILKDGFCFLLWIFLKKACQRLMHFLLCKPKQRKEKKEAISFKTASFRVADIRSIHAGGIFSCRVGRYIGWRLRQVFRIFFDLFQEVIDGCIQLFILSGHYIAGQVIYFYVG